MTRTTPPARSNPRLRACLAALLALLAGTACPSRDSEGPLSSIKGVVLISIDTLRPDFLTPYKPDLDTSPEIARLASEGSLFLNALAQASSTARSHKSILYSLYPAIHKIRPRRVLHERIDSPVEALQEAAYLTAAFVGGGQLHPKYGFAKGFDSYVVTKAEKGLRSLDALEQQALAWLEEHRGVRFFLFLHTYQMHSPYAPTEEYWERYASWHQGSLDPRDLRRAGDFRRAGLDEDDIRFIRDLYAADVAYVDSMVGRLLQALRELAIDETTMIIFLSDHGESLGERGRFGHNQLYDVHIRVPLIIRVPGLEPSRLDDPVETIDVMPTIFEALGVQPPFDFQGTSLLPLMKGSSEPWHKEYQIAQEGKRVAVRKGQWKLIFRTDRKAPGRLFHLQTDPNEEVNLGGVSPARVAEFKAYYQQRMAAAADIASRFSREGAVDPTQDEEVRRQLEALGYLE